MHNMLITWMVIIIFVVIRFNTINSHMDVLGTNDSLCKADKVLVQLINSSDYPMYFCENYVGTF